MTEVRKTIVSNIKEVCRIKKIKNVDIADYMGVSAGSVSNWFNGANFLDVDNLYKLCNYLGVSLDQIFGVSPIVGNVLTDEESNMLTAYRAADDRAKADALRMLEDHPAKERSNTEKKAM